MIPLQDFSSPHSAAYLAAPYMTSLPISGVSIALMASSEAQSTIYCSDAVAARLDEIQFDLGDGPTPSAFRSKQLALIEETDIPSARWPMFADEVAPMRIHSVYAFPLLLGRMCVGVVAMYRASTGRLSDAAINEGARLSCETARPAVDYAVQYAANDVAPAAVEVRREVHQATGIVLAQLSTTARDALARIRAHAFSSDRSVLAIARDIISGRINFGLLGK
jgi:hypothetical protein